MAGWFATLMQKGQARSARAIAGATRAGARSVASARDPRYDAIVQTLRERAAEDRVEREKHQRGYRQSLESDSAAAPPGSDASYPTRVHKLRTKVPCRITPDARALLDDIRARFPRGTIIFPHVAAGRQAVMLVHRAGAEPRQIGWVEQAAQDDPERCSVHEQGLSVETDGGTMLVLRFRYPPTAVTMSSSRVTPDAMDEAAAVDFAELRPALDLRPDEKISPPRNVWITRPESEALHAMQSRDYEAFYVRFKLEVQAGIWRSLSALLASSPRSQWHRGSCYDVVREPDSASRRICQRTVDDSGVAADIGADRIYDAAPATDILLLHLEGDVLADLADIYFTLRSLTSADAYFLKEEFFTVIRRFWGNADSLAAHSDNELAAVERMSQRVLPLPAQAPLLTQDWTNLRQSLVDRYGERGRKAADLTGQAIPRRSVRHGTWPFESFPVGEVNLGLRLVYRQEWRDLGAHRGDVIRAVPPAPLQLALSDTAAPGTAVRRAADMPGPDALRSVETIIEPGDMTRNLDEVMGQVISAAAEAMKWPLDCDGSINTGVRGLATMTEMGLASESREISRDTSARLSETMWKTAVRIRDEAVLAGSAEAEASVEPSASDTDDSIDDGAASYVYSRLQKRFEIQTVLAETQNVVLVAEELPTPAEIDLAWVRRHDWMLAKVLLDESFRDALNTIGQEARNSHRGRELDAKRDPLYEHIRANVLHYQRAIWEREDPQQRSMRYRKSARQVPLEWRFELESCPAMTIDELCDRLNAPNVNGQFAAYASGREVQLDQLIDPAGPIGYYGNYAVYKMRPEFGDKELFSMLHFFKSPYLRPNRETGALEIEDPREIQLSAEPAAVAAVAAIRRERSRQIAYDTDGVVIDVIRHVEAVPAETESGFDDDAAHASAMPADYELLLESGDAFELLDAHGHHDAEPDWTILERGGERMPRLLAGAGPDAARTADSVTALVIVARSEGGDPMPHLLAGLARREDSDTIRARDDRALLLSAGSGPSPSQEGMILSQGDEQRTPKLVAGLGAHDAPESVIVPREECCLRLTPRAGIEASAAFEPSTTEERVIVPRIEREGTSALLAGAGVPDAQERPLLTRDGGASSLIAGNARGVNDVRERLILSGENESLRPGLIAR